MFNSYSETLDFLYSQLPMYQRVGAVAMKKDLSNTLALMNALGHPESTYPSIHIAGTNGKGTVSHMIAACYQEAGMKVGLYTSPHYRDFRERIKVNGEMVSESEVIAFVNGLEQVIREVQPSFFELTVAMAFHCFAKHEVDIVVVETGLGGRLDSTNVITPKLSVITNISYDHMDMLGDTLTAIAGEKAGIIKQGVPVVIGERGEESDKVFMDTAVRLNAPIVFAQDVMDCSLLKDKSEVLDLRCRYVNDDRDVLNLEVHNAGPFTPLNARTALTAIETLGQYEPHLALATQVVSKGLATFDRHTAYTGRWRVLGQRPLIIADSAHNPGALKVVANHLLEMRVVQLYFVLGFVTGKDIAEALSFFPKDGFFFFCKPDVPRGLSTELVAETARELGLEFELCDSVSEALKAAQLVATERDMIYIGGSSFVVAEVV